MADLAEITEEFRTDDENGSKHENEAESPRQSGTKRKKSRTRRRRNSGGSQGAPQASRAPEEGQEEVESGGRAQPQADDRKEEISPTGEADHQAKFYEHYREVAQEFDKEFLKKYDEDLNTTLIFAGLFSAVTSAFIIQVASQLQPDSGDETAALLRIIIYKMDNTTFGNNVPTLPQWTGPPRTIVQVQAILFASLAASLFSAFLAMLGKQWLNRYESTDKRGTAIERSQNRQRKLDGINSWYFNYVMESLPLMLQAALLLLGCALSRYLWDIDITIASVVLGITSIGIILYIFIIIAGVATERCPYQTPGSQFLRYLGRKLHSGIALALRNTFRKTIETIRLNAEYYHPWWSSSKIKYFFRDLFFELPRAFATDALSLCRAGIQALLAPPIKVYHLLRRVRDRPQGTPPTPEERLTRKTATLDVRCISWTLQTSLDKAIHMSALLYLLSVLELAEFDPSLVVDCFNIFISSISVTNQRVAATRGLEQLAAVSAGCFCRILHRLAVIDLNSSVLADIRRRYRKILPGAVDFTAHPSRRAMFMIHALITCGWISDQLWCEDRPSGHEHITLARDFTVVALAEYQRVQRVPNWILHFALNSLSLDPLPPVPIVAACLMIIAIDLGCDISNIVTLDESVQAEQVCTLITQKLQTMVETGGQDPISSKRLAICTLLPYAIFLGQSGQQGLVNSIICAAGASKQYQFLDPICAYFITLFGKPSSPFLNQVIVLASPHIDWDRRDMEEAIVGWAAAVTAVADTEEVRQSVVDTLLQMASVNYLQPLTPIKIWTWMKKRPSLPPVCRGRLLATNRGLVSFIQGLRDLEILKSYFLLVWSEWDYINFSGLGQMELSIREEFGGTGMWDHQEDLIRRLDEVLEQLDQGLEHLRQHNPYIDQACIERAQHQYWKLKDVLLDMDGKAMKTLTQSHSTFMCALHHPCL